MWKVRKHYLKAILLLDLVGSSVTTFAETQTTVSLTAPQIFSGYQGNFTVSQTTGAVSVAAGTIDYTYAGVMKYYMSSASGRYDGFSGSTRYGVSFGPFQLFQSFLSANFFTVVSASRICPSAQNYNWMSVRYRTPALPSNAMDATSTSFYAGGNLSLDPSGSDLLTGNSTFNLTGPTLDNSTAYSYDAFNGVGCASGSQKISANLAKKPLDTFGTLFFGDQSFFFISTGGNPVVSVGVAEETLTVPGMAAVGQSVFSGLYTRFQSSSSQTRENIYLAPDVAGTTFTIYRADSLTDPSSRTALGSIACTSLNSPANGFCSGTISLSGVGGTGNAVCMISTVAPESLITCSAQSPTDLTLPISIIARVPQKAVVSVTGSATAASVVAPGGSTTMTLTIKNLTGRAVSAIANPVSGALQITAPFTNPGAYTGVGGTCGASLSGYETCTVDVTFSPSAVGTYKQTYRVAYNDGYFGTVNATFPLVATCGLTSVDITPGTASFASGSTIQYTATATYSDASTQDVTQAATWGTSDSAVATTNSEGTVTFSGLGATNVTISLAATSDSQGVTSSAGSSIEVLGQSSATSIGGATTGLNNPRKVLVVGSRLLVSDTNNHRVLIWNTIPVSDQEPADLVLGQPDFDNNTANYDGTVAANTLSSPHGIASDGTNLVVADTGNHRVLIWPTIPTTTQEAATYVLGQTLMTTATANQGGRSAATLSSPRFVAISGTKLLVSDSSNNRVLIWNTMPTANKTAANIYLGQPAANVGTANNGGLSASTLNAPYGLTVAGSILYVADYTNHRVLGWNSVPAASSTAADFALGQPDLVSNTANNGGRTAQTLSNPSDVSSDGTVLFVSDYSNHRVLKWSALPAVTQTAANYVLGQTLFTTATANQGGIGASTLSNPISVFTDSTRTLVVDYTNHRVLLWTAVPSSNKPSATIVVGQPNFTSSQPNSDGVPAADSIARNDGVYNDGTHLIVSDTLNNRVLIWNTIPSSNGQTADLVLGQPDFVSNTANNGGRSASTLSAPRGIYSNGTKLAIADYSNHRVLIWNTFPTINGQAADLVLGQASMAAGTANSGGRSAQSFNAPIGVTFDGTNFYVADYSNHRVLIWSGIPTINRQAATLVLGQPDMASGTANNGGISAQTLSNPRSIYSNGSRLFVSDYSNHRVLIWNTIPASNQAAADLALGQANTASNTSNSGGRSASSLANPAGLHSDGTRLFVCDYSNNRVLVWDALPTATQQAASRLIGQQTFATNTANNGGISARSLQNPLSIFADGTRAWISDYSNYRVLVSPINAQLSISDGPTYDYGDVILTQASDKTYTVTNSGFFPATGVIAGTPSLSSPFTFVGGSYPGTAGTCTATISGSTSCTIKVRFNPSAEAADFSSVVRLSYSDGTNTKLAAVAVTGRGISQSLITFNDGASYNYGSVLTNATLDRAFTISNSSGVTASLMTPGTPALAGTFLFKGGQFPGQGGTCGTFLKTGQSCTVMLRFAPTSLGAKADTFRLNYNNGNSTQSATIALSGTGS